MTLRIRAEREVTRGRAAILKAYYLRNYPTELNKEVFTVSLNESSNVPYVLGRLFSVLETIQSVANPGINATIKDRYFNSACATPATAFPTLVKLAQKHLQKMSTPNEVHFSKQLTELMAQLPETGFPARLSLPEQGAFEIGYYHQTQKRYAKRMRRNKPCLSPSRTAMISSSCSTSRTATPTATPMQAICPASTPRRATVW